MSFYFDKFESRTPPLPLQNSLIVESLWQFFGSLSIGLGAWYLHWRWTQSLNLDALWYSIPLVVAETAAFIGLLLFTYNLWRVEDTDMQPAPMYLSEVSNIASPHDRNISIDVFFPSFDEEVELVRLSIIDAKKMRYPHSSVKINIYVLDDSSRQNMSDMAKSEGVHYISRDNNIGFKAGNLRNAMEQTSGDFIVICDADTRPFNTLLENTMGYFRDPDVAWVQTPQWFYDIPEGRNLPQVLKRYLSYPGVFLGHGIQCLFGRIKVGRDPFCSDPRMFYDIIQRRRNRVNASFCCGAGSIHRREAVMSNALKQYSDNVKKHFKKDSNKIVSITKEKQADPTTLEQMKAEIIKEQEVMPYRFHVSEDIYTSIILQSDSEKDWKSILHPQVESKMLSPQDLLSWSIQRFKYAGGTLDIALNDNPIIKKNMSIPQRLMYASTIWSYIGGLWNMIFLLAPLIYFFSGIAPISTDAYDFFIHFIPFILINEIASMFSTWGMPTYRAKASYISFFWLNIMAISTVLRRKTIKFNVTPKYRQEGSFLNIVLPHITIICLSITGIIFSFYLHFTGSQSYSIDALIFNSFWALNNIIALSGIVFSAFWNPTN